MNLQLKKRALLMAQHTRLEYLEAVDMAYIDTGYVPTENTAFEFEAMFNLGAQVWYGSIAKKPIQYSRFHGGSESNGVLRIYSNHGNSIDGIEIYNDELYHVYYISKTLCKLDETEKAADLILPNLSIYIMGRHAENVNSAVFYSTNRCRYAKIYENGELVRHFVPVLKNGEHFMYEQVQGRYYGNDADVGYFTGG